MDKCRIITIIGSKGGVGTSFVTVNLSVGLARQSKKRTALVEIESKQSSSSLMLGLKPKDIAENLKKQQQLQDVTQRRLKTLSQTLTKHMRIYLSTLSFQ